MARTTRSLAFLRAQFVLRLTKETSPWFNNPFNELASIPSWLIQHRLPASGRRQTSHIHRSSDRLRPVIRLFASTKARSVLTSSRPPQSRRSMCRYIVHHPMAPIPACNTSNGCLWTQRSLRVHSPSWVLVAAMSCIVWQSRCHESAIRTREYHQQLEGRARKNMP